MFVRDIVQAMIDGEANTGLASIFRQHLNSKRSRKWTRAFVPLLRLGT